MKVFDEILYGVLRGILPAIVIIIAVAMVHMAYKAGPNLWWLVVALQLVNLPKSLVFVWRIK